MFTGRLGQKKISVGDEKVVDRISFSCVGSVFRARGAATDKALSAIRRRVRGDGKFIYVYNKVAQIYQIYLNAGMFKSFLVFYHFGENCFILS